MKITNSSDELRVEINPLSKIAGLTLFWGGVLSVFFLESTVFTSAHLKCSPIQI
jgi:hypothetical protein